MKKVWWWLAGITSAVLVYSSIEPYWQKIRRYIVHNHKIPEDFEGFKIIFIADIHYGRTLKKSKLAKVVKKMNSYKPDLILLGGDYVMKASYIEECFNELGKLKAKHGVYAVIGNHDVDEGLEETMYAMENAGIGSINNDSIWIKKAGKIKIGGVGDLWTQQQILARTTADTTKEDYVILVSHNPKYIYQLDEKDHVDLMLSGHTHGGQCTPIRHLGKIAPERIKRATGVQYLSGKRQREGRDIIISNGIGTAKFPLRFLARPDVVMITLKQH